MYPQFAHRLRRLLRLCLLGLAWPLLAQANLPVAANVPGGIAIIHLGKVIEGKAIPQAWLGEQPVLVTVDKSQWYAVVGLSLDMKAGSHELRVQQSDETKIYRFKINIKKYPEQHVYLKDTGKVQLSAENQARAERDIARIQSLKHYWRDSPETDTSFVIPAKGRLGGRFGSRRFFNGESRAPHVGVDVVVPQGTAVKASGQGKVLAIEDYFFNGKTIFVDHGNGLITLYCHLSQFSVQVGESLNKGQVIGLSGATGRATGPHLHWSVVLNGVMVDPALFISARQK